MVDTATQPEQVAKLLPFGSVAQLVRALPCHGKGRGFKSHQNRQAGVPPHFAQNFFGFGLDFYGVYGVRFAYDQPTKGNPNAHIHSKLHRHNVSGSKL